LSLSGVACVAGAGFVVQRGAWTGARVAVGPTSYGVAVVSASGQAGDAVRVIPAEVPQHPADVRRLEAWTLEHLAILSPVDRLPVRTELRHVAAVHLGEHRIEVDAQLHGRPLDHVRGVRQGVGREP